MRRGFTLMELLVVIVILLILTGLTVTGVRLAFASDLARGGARQVQSFLSGAKDLAISSREKRGVRFLIDSTNTRTSTSMVYIAEQPHWTAGSVRLERFDRSPEDGVADGPDIRVVRGHGGTGWWNLSRQKFIVNQKTRIRIPRGGREWYVVDTSLLSPTREILILTAPYRQQDTFGSPESVQVHRSISDYELELPPAILPGQEPVTLPSGIVIDLDGSKLPLAWRPSGSGSYPSGLDLMFSPRGTVVGSAASVGTIHFLITQNFAAERSGAIAWNSSTKPRVPIWANAATKEPMDAEQLLVTIFTQTGNISASNLHMGPDANGDGQPDDSDGDGNYDDPFLFAETGETAGQ